MDSAPMKITRIFAHRVELPLHEGTYKWSGGKSVSVFDSTIVGVGIVLVGCLLVPVACGLLILGHPEASKETVSVFDHSGGLAHLCRASVQLGRLYQIAVYAQARGINEAEIAQSDGTAEVGCPLEEFRNRCATAKGAAGMTGTTAGMGSERDVEEGGPWDCDLIAGHLQGVAARPACHRPTARCRRNFPEVGTTDVVRGTYRGVDVNEFRFHPGAGSRSGSRARSPTLWVSHGFR